MDQLLDDEGRRFQQAVVELGTSLVKTQGCTTTDLVKALLAEGADSEGAIKRWVQRNAESLAQANSCVYQVGKGSAPGRFVRQG